MIYWITAICICAAMLVQYLCSSRIMPMKQAISLNKAGPTRYPLRERTPERAGDVPRQPAGQPPQAISRLSPIPRSSSPPQGEGAGGPRSRVPPTMDDFDSPEHTDREPEDSQESSGTTVGAPLTTN